MIGRCHANTRGVASQTRRTRCLVSDDGGMCSLQRCGRDVGVARVTRETVGCAEIGSVGFVASRCVVAAYAKCVMRATRRLDAKLRVCCHLGDLPVRMAKQTPWAVDTTRNEKVSDRCMLLCDAISLVTRSARELG